MKHRKLPLRSEVVRTLRIPELKHVQGGGTELETCSMCPGLDGCVPPRQ